MRIHEKGSKSLSQALYALAGDGLAVAVVGLTLLGVSGLVYKSLKPDGWISVALESLWHQSPVLVWVGGVGFSAAVVAIKRYYARTPTHRTSSGNLAAYTFVGLGLFFFLKLVVTGTL